MLALAKALYIHVSFLFFNFLCVYGINYGNYSYAMVTVFFSLYPGFPYLMTLFLSIGRCGGDSDCRWGERKSPVYLIRGGHRKEEVVVADRKSVV